MRKNKTLHDLTPVESAVLAKAAGGDASDITRKILPGIYSGSVTVKVDFTLTKALPFDVAPTSNLLSKVVIAKALVQMGAQADNFLTALEKAAQEALVDAKQKESKVADVLTEADKRILDKIARLEKDVIAKLPRQERSGPTSLTFDLHRIQEVQLAKESTEAVA